MISHNAGRWRGVTIVVALFGSLAGCGLLTTSPNLTPDEQNVLSVSLKEKYVAYQDCMAAESDRFSHITSAPPSDIAWGAQAGCEDSFRNYQHAVTNQFTAFVSDAGKAEARKQAEQHASETENRIRGRVIQRVLIQRQ